MREDNRKGNSGFTLVEVLVAVAILAIVSIPVLQSFVSVVQVNSKSRRRLAATTIAESLMESCKGMSLVEIATQVDYDSVPITFVLDPGSTSFSGTASEMNAALTAIETNKAVTLTSSGYKLNAKNTYVFWVKSIKSGGSSYDAVIKYEFDSTRNKGTFGTGVSVEDTLVTKAGMASVMKYYNITINVYRSTSLAASLSASEPLVTVQGSVADRSK
ncbi:MAG: type II secretion system GspH family protein [Lachnospiraceae bacterium]|nr:type II secretion system GspH family protein [Lachnospiraceae bacterium]